MSETQHSVTITSFQEVASKADGQVLFMSSKRQPSDKETHQDSLQNSSPLSELYSITAGLRAQMLRLEKQGVWGIPHGSRSPSTDSSTDRPMAERPRPTNQRQGSKERATTNQSVETDMVTGSPAKPGKAVGEATEQEKTGINAGRSKKEKVPGTCTKNVTAALKQIDDKGQAGLKKVRQLLGECARCPLFESRNNIVFGEGNPNADLVFIGEAPGFEEDRTGIPFVGAAGSLFTKMLKAMGLEREEVYIANILKCRPPRNRDPLPEEKDHCKPFLLAQLQCIEPAIIITLGRIAAQTLLDTTTPISVLRGEFRQFLEWQLMPTFHPAYLLRNKSKKRPAWEDLQAVMAEMDRLGLKRRR